MYWVLFSGDYLFNLVNWWLDLHHYPQYTIFLYNELSTGNLQKLTQSHGASNYLDPSAQLTSPHYKILFTRLRQHSMDFLYSLVLAKGSPKQDTPLAPHDLSGRGGSVIPKDAGTKAQRCAWSTVKHIANDCSDPTTQTQQITLFSLSSDICFIVLCIK